MTSAPDQQLPNMNRHGGLHRNLVPIYDIAETRYVKNLVPQMPLRSSALRCLGAALNVFAIESFLDEIAGTHSHDPIALRKAHLSDPRASQVLDRLELVLRSRPLAEGQGRGIAYAQYKNAMTRVGAAVDLIVSDAAQIELQNIVLVADAGRIVDPDGLRAQLEGGALQAASWALFEAVTWDRDGVTSRDWDSYPVLRFSDVPKIETILLDHPETKSLGAGEASPASWHRPRMPDLSDPVTSRKLGCPPRSNRDPYATVGFGHGIWLTPPKPTPLFCCPLFWLLSDCFCNCYPHALLLRFSLLSCLSQNTDYTTV